ncbi:MAG: NAD synthetase [Clostridiaceae bacterium BRH_c20a]|nr:MAG: NAD synthetase [Clostridiaceae bacterium BRH_c20a]
MKKISEKIQYTIDWLRNQVENSGTKGLIVGVSGGIDSALCSFLIKKAFPNNSLGLIMPCDSNPQDKEDGLKVVTTCGLKYLTIDLCDTHRDLFVQVKDNLEDFKDRNFNLNISQANLKARLRMSTLYAVANALNYLVVGTDNAAEAYTGYFTKYGDGGVDILPIAKLTKREVRQWSREVGVPEEIIEKQPSAGLWLNQTDEVEMGTTYDMIDDFIEGKEVPEKDRLIIEKLHKISYHKREMPPQPPKL